MIELEPQSQGWLNAAIAGNKLVSDLRLGIAIYYCKIVEREMASKLFQPFAEKYKATVQNEFDENIRDLQKSLQTGFMPGLGSMTHALRVANRPNEHYDSKLLRTWRKYLDDLPEPQKSAVRSQEFIEDLFMLSNIRNRVAHLGDLTTDEFEKVRESVLDNQQPGSVLSLLGIN